MKCHKQARRCTPINVGLVLGVTNGVERRRAFEWGASPAWGHHRMGYYKMGVINGRGGWRKTPYN